MLYEKTTKTLFIDCEQCGRLADMEEIQFVCQHIDEREHDQIAVCKNCFIERMKMVEP